MPNFIPDFLAGALGVILIDLVLSGDNAVVIGMAARRLPSRQRFLAILLGGLGAVALRILFAAGVSFLLTIPLLEAIGGLLLLRIAWKLLHDEPSEHDVSAGGSLMGALSTIVIADLVMSLDNVLAIAGVSHGDLTVLVLGLALSMPLVLAGSGLIATLVGRLPWLMPVGASVLAWTGGGMIVNDHIVGQAIPDISAVETLLMVTLAAAVVGPSVLPAMVRHGSLALARIQGKAAEE
ncbi:MAG TPA: TerC family protein [Chloroflexota bacterium]|nr:TerC family protein [Chloroflexota bacterium]